MLWFGQSTRELQMTDVLEQWQNATFVLSPSVNIKRRSHPLVTGEKHWIAYLGAITGFYTMTFANYSCLRHNDGALT